MCVHVHVHKKRKTYEKIILHVHLRTWSSSKVKCHGISCNISPLSGQYGILWTALGERGLVSGNMITWHVITITYTGQPITSRMVMGCPILKINTSCMLCAYYTKQWASHVCTCIVSATWHSRVKRTCYWTGLIISNMHSITPVTAPNKDAHPYLAGGWVWLVET